MFFHDQMTPPPLPRGKEGPEAMPKFLTVKLCAYHVRIMCIAVLIWCPDVKKTKTQYYLSSP